MLLANSRKLLTPVVDNAESSHRMIELVDAVAAGRASVVYHSQYCWSTETTRIMLTVKIHIKMRKVSWGDIKQMNPKRMFLNKGSINHTKKRETKKSRWDEILELMKETADIAKKWHSI